jgi:hypothetical protein
MVPFPRVFSSRELRRIIPALGALSVSLSAGVLLLPQRPIDLSLALHLAPEAAQAAPFDDLGLRAGFVSDIGPHAPGAFVSREAGGKPHYRFVAVASAATPASLARTRELPTPPARPAELQNAGAAVAVEPAHTAANVPTPPRRPGELTAALRPEPPREQRREASAVAPIPSEPIPSAPAPAPAPRQIARTTVVPAAPADSRGFLERLFGGAPHAAAPQAASREQAMAYASSSDTGGLFGGLHSAVAPSNPTARYDRYTAIYDISARMVYLPNGQRLEAHSGLREHLDDPRYVHLRMRGPTPPHLYELSPREALFHGVEALRLNPVGGGGAAIYHRAGLLAHTYMLGPNGDSNGCVSFRNYEAFLNAYKRGEIRRLAVVSHL